MVRAVCLSEDRGQVREGPDVGTGSQSPRMSPQTTFPPKSIGSRKGGCRQMRVKKSVELAAARTPQFLMFFEDQNVYFWSFASVADV